MRGPFLLAVLLVGAACESIHEAAMDRAIAQHFTPRREYCYRQCENHCGEMLTSYLPASCFDPCMADAGFSNPGC